MQDCNNWRSETAPKHDLDFVFVLTYININSSNICPGAYRYFDIDQSGTGTHLEPVFDAHPFLSVWLPPLLPFLFNGNPQDQTKPGKENKQVETEVKQGLVSECLPLHGEK